MSYFFGCHVDYFSDTLKRIQNILIIFVNILKEQLMSERGIQNKKAFKNKTHLVVVDELDEGTNNDWGETLTL